MPQTPVNFYGGSPLNRLSWLRTSQTFLNAIIALPSTRWLLFNAGQPLVASSAHVPTKPSSVYLTTNDVKPLLGAEPYFGQGQQVGVLLQSTASKDSHYSPTETARHLGSRIVFLGLHEPQSDDNPALPSSEFTDPDLAMPKLKGTPYFAMDVADLDLPHQQVQEILTLAVGQGQVPSWTEPRGLMSSTDQFSAAVFASARSLVDWNSRNKFCPACGSPTYSLWGGWKIACSSLLPWQDSTERAPCPTSKGQHNFTYPRTDAAVIMIAIDETGGKVLLGRNAKFPGNFYSALAGFLEPGESFEDAVVREMWEEAGVRVWDVKYHSGQPWPYPSNLMVGFYARADSTKPIRTDLDNELVDARWYTRQEVLHVLNHPEGTRFTRTDVKKMAEITEGRQDDSQPSPAASEATRREGDPPFRLPPTTAIAGVLIRDWADGKIGFYEPEGREHKGNL